MSFKDELYTDYVCETVEIIRDEERYKMLENPNLEPIVIALRKGPKTVNELVNDYNAIVKEKIKKMNLPRKESEVLVEKMSRQAKTLYKYLKKLKENGFVVEAGKRYTKNQRAAEILYGRTSKLFFYIGGKEPLLESDSIKPSLKFLSKLIGLMNQKPKPNIKNIVEILGSIEKKVSQDLENLFTSYSKEIAEFSEDITYEDLRFLMPALNFILLMKNLPDFEEDLKRSKII